MGYFYQKEGSRWTIRRYVLVDGKEKQPRHPYKLYKHLKSEEQIKAYVDKLNYDAESKKRIKVRMAFLPTDTLEEFRSRLQAEIPSQKDAKYLYGALHRYCFEFFVSEKGLLNPTEWRDMQSQWGMYLIEQGLSSKTIRHITQVTNRFMDFLGHSKLKPLTKARLKEHEALRLIKSPTHQGLFIKDDDWLVIKEVAKASGIQAAIEIMYSYGLRRSEVFGLREEDVRNAHLSIERQFGNTPLKGRAARKCPHWFISADESFRLIRWINPMHPDTLYSKWSELMEALKFPYQLHDLRRTFITRALDSKTALQVQLAVGHVSINTTMKYIRDSRELDDRPFIPKSG